MPVSQCDVIVILDIGEIIDFATEREIPIDVQCNIRTVRTVSTHFVLLQIGIKSFANILDLSLSISNHMIVNLTEFPLNT